MEPERIVMVFAKAPRPGQVKTRLAAGIGEQEAVRIYRILAERTWNTLMEGRGKHSYRLWLCFDPPAAAAELRRWLPGADLYLPQVPGDLGVRIEQAFKAAFLHGAEVAAVVGTDAPVITAELAGQGLAQSGPATMAVGPSLDGGFYFLGLGRNPGLPGSLFQGIPWSSAETLAAVQGKAAVLGLATRLLPMLRDIDTEGDLIAHRAGTEGAAFPL